MLGNFNNQLQFLNVGQTPLIMSTTNGFAVVVASEREFEVGDGFTKIHSHLRMSEKRITSVADPTEDQDAATKKYVDVRKPLITVWAEENGPIVNGS